jgi:hypothetical protein
MCAGTASAEPTGIWVLGGARSRTAKQRKGVRAIGEARLGGFRQAPTRVAQPLDIRLKEEERWRS